MPSDAEKYATTVVTLRAAGCVYAEDEAALLHQDERDLDVLVARRVAGEPLEQVLGWAEFGGLRINLRPGVFVPRQRTLLLAEQAGSALSAQGLAVDLCCGSGAIAAWLEQHFPRAELYAADIDPTAVACARTNVRDVTVLESDLFAALPTSIRGRVDVLVANTPYVPSAEVAHLPPEARVHEPLHTLDGGLDGLYLLRRIAAEAGAWLRPGGLVLIEISESQRDSSGEAFGAAGLDVSFVVDEESGTCTAIGSNPVD